MVIKITRRVNTVIMLVVLRFGLPSTTTEPLTAGLAIRHDMLVDTSTQENYLRMLYRQRKSTQCAIQVSDTVKYDLALENRVLFSTCNTGSRTCCYQVPGSEVFDINHNGRSINPGLGLLTKFRTRQKQLFYMCLETK
jgi:hypothetical protein